MRRGKQPAQQAPKKSAKPPKSTKKRQRGLRVAIRKALAGRAEAHDRPGFRGWNRPGGGPAMHVEAAPEYRGTSVQVCGLWPFSAGMSSQVIGAPLGRHLFTGATVCADPVSWFLAKLISSPSLFVLALNGRGKSSLIRRMAAVMPAWGYIPMILSDLKPDYSELVTALGGQVITVGRGRGNVNPLDSGPMADMLHRLPERERREAIADMEGRRLNVMIGLCELVRKGPLEDFETTLLARALRVLDREHEGVPVMRDVLDIVLQRHPDLAAVAQDRGDVGRYADRTERLIDALIALGEDGPYGDTFARPTSTPMMMDRPVSFDISSVQNEDKELQAGLQLVCWSYGSSAISAAKFLAEAGLAPRRVYFMVFDELWRALNASPLMVDRIDELTRLNRQRVLAQALITHTFADLTLATEEATKKARGFVERSSMVCLGGLPEDEMTTLRKVVPVTRAEERLITDWSMPGDRDPVTGEAGAPPGRGKFLLKIGREPGTPLEVELTGLEAEVNDTNRHWKDVIASRRGEPTWSGEAS
ncbi:hypothetical protein VV02_02870 [Luteipulveratus mongoliensis]|uniref:ATP/GTP-binding protein n=1 Tax=Luteipulveratus mongoliensis TaxID=571913 RepID=A0A0K1JPQ8_9MICO|nr:hypothetical protein VV02_02870 [Luteipulveratus mongoliensis]